MPKNEEIRHSALIVSASEKFDSFIRRSLKGFIMVESRKNAAVARRCVLERYYDLIAIDAPLPDESGEQLALDIAEQCSASILYAAPPESYDDVQDRLTGQGILVVSKPLSEAQISYSVRFLTAVQNRMHQLEKRVMTVEEKMEELRTVTRAKFLLVENKYMTENEAHRFIGKQAMDHGVSRKRIAEKIFEEFE